MLYIKNLPNFVADFLYKQKQGVVLNGQSFLWATIEAGFPQDVILGPLFFLIYMNDLSDDLAYKQKLFADDISQFSVVENKIKSINYLNNDLAKITTWALRWKI